jgi:hypothetical protein
MYIVFASNGIMVSKSSEPSFQRPALSALGLVRQAKESGKSDSALTSGAIKNKMPDFSGFGDVAQPVRATDS